MLKENISNTNDSFERYKERLSNFSGEFELGLFLFLARKSVIWIVLLFGIAFFSAYLYLRYTPPVFEASSTIQIQSNNQAKQVLNVDALTEPENGLAEGVEMLRSKVFFKRVLSRLPLQVSYYAEGTFKVFELYKSSPYTVETKIKNSGIIGSKIYVDFDNDHEGIVNYSFAGNKYSKSYYTDQWIEFPEISIKLKIENYDDIKKQQNIVKKNAFFFVVNDSNSIINEYYPFLDVKLLSDLAKTIKISFKDYNPQKASDIVTSVTDEYKSLDVEKKGESSKSVINFINTQLDTVYNQLKSSEDTIQDFKKNNNVNENENVILSNTNRINSLEDQIISLQLDENVLNNIEKNLQNSKSSDTYTFLAMLAGSSNEDNVKSVIEDLHKLLIRKEEMLFDVKPNTEATRAIDFQIDIQKKLLKESLKSLRENIHSREEDLKSKAVEVEKKDNKLPKNEVEYGRLQRLFSINEKYYNLLLEKKTEYSISKAGFVSTISVLEKADIPTSPVSPNRKTTFIIYFVTALVISLLIIFLRYLSHNEINSLNEITKFTHASISILGIIPKCKVDIPVSQLLVDKSPKSLIAEAFRSVRTNLQFISNEPGSKIIALTSTISGEGKTFVAINLAGIIAFSGKKVVIIDLDMRKPKIHIGFGAENSIGMSTLLIGKNTVDEAIQKSNLENLDIITAGPVPPNPSELIISKKMDDILEYLKTIYDVIIIDNPPVGLVSDGIAMIQKADYPIYIFRADYSKRNFIQNVDRLFNEASIQRLSVMLNGVDIDRKNYGYNYGYGYGYGYGTSYGYYDDDKDKSSKKKSFFKK